MKKILVLAGDFVEDYEIMVPVQTLETIGFDVKIACPGKKPGETIKTAIHDFEGDQTYTEKRGHNFAINEDFDSLNLNDYAGLYIPGGRAPEYLRLDKRVLEVVKAFEKKPIAAICHGIQILVTADMLQGVKATAYPAVGPDITLAGGEYIEVGVNEAVTCNNITTSPAWPGHPALMKEFIKLLGVEIKL